MLPRKNFENLHAVMAILVLFAQFSAKFCLKFLFLILSASPNMMHFVRTFSTTCYLRHKAYCYQRLEKRFKIMKKLYIPQTFLKMAGGRMHIPHPTPLAISYRKHQKSSPYFSH